MWSVPREHTHTFAYSTFTIAEALALNRTFTRRHAQILGQLYNPNTKPRTQAELITMFGRPCILPPPRTEVPSVDSSASSGGYAQKRNKRES